MSVGRLIRNQARLFPRSRCQTTRHRWRIGTLARAARGALSVRRAQNIAALARLDDYGTRRVALEINMGRYRGRDLWGLTVRHAHAETQVEYNIEAAKATRVPSLSSLDRAALLQRKVHLEAADAEIALRISVFQDPNAIEAFETIPAELALIERDLAGAWQNQRRSQWRRRRQARSRRALRLRE